MATLIFRPEIGAESPFWSDDGHMVWMDTLPLPDPLRVAERSL
jgi:hypothetical protein